MFSRILTAILFTSPMAAPATASVTEFCLDGEFDLGARYQGTRPLPGEWYPATWCVATDDETDRVLFAATGRSNPDLEGSWRVAYLPPDLVRIVNRDNPPDIEFHGTDNPDEARRVRRIDPRRLIEELGNSPRGIDGIRVKLAGGRVETAVMEAALPLRGQVDVAWRWDWQDADRPGLVITVDDVPMFRADGRWRDVPEPEAETMWQATSGAEAVEVPGENWPARVNMRLVELADGVYLVRGVRTGFQHIVVDTGRGLVVGDAPAGWVELHQLPPEDLVPGRGISGLSGGLVDFLADELPGRPLHAVAITHFHDDHAGGARAFAAAGAAVYASDESAAFLESALNRPAMPDDALAANNGRIEIRPVHDSVMVGGSDNPVSIMSIGAGPHAYAMLGLHAPERGFFFVSDIHVPNSDAAVPRAERAATECWFAAWAVRRLPLDTLVVNSHSAPMTPVSRLAEYLDSEICKGRETPGRNDGEARPAANVTVPLSRASG